MAETEKKLKYPNLTDYTIEFVDKGKNHRHLHVITGSEDSAKKIIKNTYKKSKIEAVRKNKKKW